MGKVLKFKRPLSEEEVLRNRTINELKWFAKQVKRGRVIGLGVVGVKPDGTPLYTGRTIQPCGMALIGGIECLKAEMQKNLE